MTVLSSNSDSTCWTLINGAARGEVQPRDDFARRYVGVVRAYFSQRWARSPLIGELDDVVQEVFIECFRQGGVLERIQKTRPASFRAFLYGVSRNIALRCERRIGRLRERQPTTGLTEDVSSDEATLSAVFDSAWARALLRQARLLLENKARQSTDGGKRRLELLRLRTAENLPIREIASLWSLDAARLHKEYSKAKSEFRECLDEVLRFHHPGCSAVEIQEKCSLLLDLVR